MKTERSHVQYAQQNSLHDSPHKFRISYPLFTRMLAGVTFAFCMMLLASSALFAQGDEPLPQPDDITTVESAAVDPASTSAVSADDGGTWELGVHGSAGNLMTATAAERAGMWTWLNGWFVRRYSYAENLAWEEDFKRAALGGQEHNYLDTVDLQFYVGHGSPGRITFDNASHDDGAMDAPNDCNTSWGNGDNEWFAITSCQVLSGSGLSDMALCMNRQHLVLGFVTNASAHNYYKDTQAYHYGRYMRMGWNQTQAWFNACDIAQRGRTTRVIAEHPSCFNDNPYFSSVCSDSYDNTYHWQTHACGTASANVLPASTLQAITDMPVYQVPDYSPREAAADFRQLGAAFGISVTETLQSAGLLAPNDEGPPPSPPDGSPFLVAQTASPSPGVPGRVLTMDQNSGLFLYSNLNSLFTQQAVEAAYQVNSAAANYIDQDSARRVAERFLAEWQLIPGDAVFNEVVQDLTGQLDRTQGSVSAADVEGAEVPTNWQVIYVRELEPVTVPGIVPSQQVTFSVVGPGAKLKVYVPLESAVTPLGAGEPEVLGVQGGWRAAVPQVNAASGHAVMTPILDQATIDALYLALDDRVTMNSLPMEIESRVLLTHTLAYYESTPGVQQGELIPVYELAVLVTDAATGAQSLEMVYVPASPQYMRPLAQIVDAPLFASSGVSMTLTAADASKTLSENGYAGFDFVMGYGGAAGPYAYEWYIDQIDPANQIAGCNTLACSFTTPRDAAEKGGVFTVVLVVRDEASPNESQGTDAVSIDVPLLFLPTVEGTDE